MEKELLKLLNNAYAPYSKYKVAAIVEIKDGTTLKELMSKMLLMGHDMR